jgi:dye decolorizing peroxidase
MTTPPEEPRRLGRRVLLAWSGSAGLAGLAGLGAGAELLGRRDEAPVAVPDHSEAARLAPADDRVTDRSTPMGLAGRVPAFGTLLAFDLTAASRRTPRTARATAVDLLRHAAALADETPGDDADDPVDAGAAGLDLRPASLEIVPGFGASLLDACGLAAHRPEPLVDLPAFATDRLDTSLCGGDLMVQVAAEDPLRRAGVVQQLLSFVRSRLAGRLTLRWSRAGFRTTAAGAENPATTSRNLMGHRDGTNNPPLGTPLWRVAVQAQEPDWMAGGSYLVARQILIDLDAWFEEDEATRDRVIGRHTTNGAAFGGHREHQPVNLLARTDAGHLIIPEHAHIRLASSQNTDGARIYRRSWNFDDGYLDGRRHAGLLFLAWQADIRQGFLPIQRRLTSGHDALNGFTTHVGSAVFAVPARQDDAYVGQRLLEAS